MLLCWRCPLLWWEDATFMPADRKLWLQLFTLFLCPYFNITTFHKSFRDVFTNICPFPSHLFLLLFLNKHPDVNKYCMKSWTGFLCMLFSAGETHTAACDVSLCLPTDGVLTVTSHWGLRSNRRNYLWWYCANNPAPLKIWESVTVYKMIWV